MKYLFIAVTMILSLTQCKTTSRTTDAVDSANEVQIETASKVDLKGHWTLIKTEIIQEKQSIERFVENTKQYIGKEQTPPVYKNNNGVLTPHSRVIYLSEVLKDLVFSEDSIFGMNYPLEFLQRISYSIEGDLLQIGNEPIKKSISLSASQDTLFFSYLDHFGLYIEETYVKTSFDESVLNMLKLYKTNFPLLAGTWKLVREEDSGDGGYYELDFPYEIPDTIVMTKEELESTLYTDRSYNMLTGEKKQKYFLNYSNSKLWLTPGDWYKDSNPSIRFEWVEKENW